MITSLLSSLLESRKYWWHFILPHIAPRGGDEKLAQVCHPPPDCTAGGVDTCTVPAVTSLPSLPHIHFSLVIALLLSLLQFIFCGEAFYVLMKRIFYFIYRYLSLFHPLHCSWTGLLGRLLQLLRIFVMFEKKLAYVILKDSQSHLFLDKSILHLFFPWPCLAQWCRSRHGRERSL